MGKRNYPTMTIFNGNGYLSSSPALHGWSIDEVQEHLVLPFSDPTSRNEIYTGLEYLIESLKMLGRKMELWLDGSFVSEKHNPGDIDLVVVITIQDYKSMTQGELELLYKYTSGGDTKKICNCDSYLLLTCSDSHGNEEEKNLLKQDEMYWLNQFGTDRANVAKGMVKLVIDPKIYNLENNDE
jgi:hypothetical protein